MRGSKSVSLADAKLISGGGIKFLTDIVDQNNNSIILAGLYGDLNGSNKIRTCVSGATGVHKDSYAYGDPNVSSGHVSIANAYTSYTNRRSDGSAYFSGIAQI